MCEALYHPWCIVMSSFVYIGLNCASLSIVLVFEAEQLNSRIISWGCRKTMLSKVPRFSKASRATKISIFLAVSLRKVKMLSFTLQVCCTTWMVGDLTQDVDQFLMYSTVVTWTAWLHAFPGKSSIGFYPQAQIISTQRLLTQYFRVLYIMPSNTIS